MEEASACVHPLTLRRPPVHSRALGHRRLRHGQGAQRILSARLDGAREESETPICLCGEVVKTSLRRFGGWKKIFEATLEGTNVRAVRELTVLP